MKINKLEGINILRVFLLPTVKLIDLNKLLNSDKKIDDDLSIRLSPKKNGQNVFLPSIHNIKNKDDIKIFIKEYSKYYNIFAHKTVKPELIGTASRLETYNKCELYMETYKDWDKRKSQTIFNGIIIPAFRDRFFLSYSKMMRKNEEDRISFMKVLMHLRKLPFETYNVEYAIEDGNIIFSELVLYY